jgi:nucleoside-diphosphate-sugar epimerase
MATPNGSSSSSMAETIAAAAGKRLPRFSLPLPPVQAAAWGLGKIFSVFKKEAPLNPSRLAFFTRPKPLNTQKAVRDIGYAPAWKFNEGMTAAVAWYRANGWL